MGRYERTLYYLSFWMKGFIKTEIFINIPGRFFHYEPLSASSFRKNLIIPEASEFSKV